MSSVKLLGWQKKRHLLQLFLPNHIFFFVDKMLNELKVRHSSDFHLGPPRQQQLMLTLHFLKTRNLWKMYLSSETTNSVKCTWNCEKAKYRSTKLVVEKPLKYREKVFQSQDVLFQTHPCRTISHKCNVFHIHASTDVTCWVTWLVYFKSKWRFMCRRSRRPGFF